MSDSMKISQKRNCNGCKGGYYESRPFRQVCLLGCKPVTSVTGFSAVPDRPCYKPLTNNDYLLVEELCKR